MSVRGCRILLHNNPLVPTTIAYNPIMFLRGVLSQAFPQGSSQVDGLRALMSRLAESGCSDRRGKSQTPLGADHARRIWRPFGLIYLALTTFRA